MSKEEETNRHEELAHHTIGNSDTGTDDPTNSNTAANSSLAKTLEELNLGAECHVIYRYSVSGLLSHTDAWKGTSPLLKRVGKPYKVYMSEPSEESVHTDYKLFCSLHCDFYNKAPRTWSKATDQEVYDMCKSKCLEADKQRRVLLNLVFTSPEVFDFLWITSGILQATGETRS